MSNVIQLYSLATPNGQKVSIALEEMDLPYDAHTINIREGEQFSDAFIRINPNSKIPAIVDPNGPDGQSITLMESGAILVYLAEKTGKFLPEDPIKRYDVFQWLFFQMGGIGPMFGQFGHFFKYGRDACDHPYPLERYTKEAQRLLGVLEKRLESHKYIAASEYTIADISIFPWVNCLEQHYEGRKKLGLKHYTNVLNWYDRCASRPAAQRGAKVCSLTL